MKRCGSVCGYHQPRSRTSDSQPVCQWYSEGWVRSATRVRQTAHWSNWADCSPIVHPRHLGVATTLVAQKSGTPETGKSRAWQLQGLSHRRGRPLHVEPPPGRQVTNQPGPGLPSQQRQLAEKRQSLPTCFGFSSQTSSAASPRGSCMPMWPFSSTPLATIVLHVLALGC